MPAVSACPLSKDSDSDDDYIDVVGPHTPLNIRMIADFKKRYHCQRCLNHGLQVERKGHKLNCPYTACECENCKLVQKRKLLNRQIYNEGDTTNDNEEVMQVQPIVVEERQTSVEDNKESTSMIKSRNPKCARCRAHDSSVIPPDLKGHKKSCPYQSCQCRKCELVTTRRDIMAKQIKLRRKQVSIRNANLKTNGGQMQSKAMECDFPTSNFHSCDQNSINQQSSAGGRTNIQDFHNPINVHLSNVHSKSCCCHCCSNSTPSAPYSSSYPTGNTIVSSEALFANFMDYMRSTVTTSSTITNSIFPPNGNTLVLPTVPAPFSTNSQPVCFAIQNTASPLLNEMTRRVQAYFYPESYSDQCFIYDQAKMRLFEPSILNGYSHIHGAYECTKMHM